MILNVRIAACKQEADGRMHVLREACMQLVGESCSSLVRTCSLAWQLLTQLWLLNLGSRLSCVRSAASSNLRPDMQTSCPSSQCPSQRPIELQICWAHRGMQRPRFLLQLSRLGCCRRMQQLEELQAGLIQGKAAAEAKAATAQADNIKLFEKIKFLESYAQKKGGGAAGVPHTSIMKVDANGLSLAQVRSHIFWGPLTSLEVKTTFCCMVIHCVLVTMLKVT